MRALLLLCLLSLPLMTASTAYARSHLSTTLGNPHYYSYGHSGYYVYPNGLIISKSYTKRSIAHMAKLSKKLGYTRVYLLSSSYRHGVPHHLKRYTKRYFHHHGVQYRYVYPKQRYVKSRHYVKTYPRYYSQRGYYRGSSPHYRHYRDHHKRGSIHFSIRF